MVFTFFLGVGVYRLARRQALVRRAVRVENIGRVTLHLLGQDRDAHRRASCGSRTCVPAPRRSTRRAAARSAALASRGESGDPLDVAILRGGTSARRRGAARARRDLSVHRRPQARDRRRARRDGGDLVAATKGAPEVVLALGALDADEREAWIDAA